VANALRLLNLRPALAQMVESGKLSAGHARALLSIEDEKLQAQAAAEVLARELSVRKTEQLAARLLRAPKEEHARDPLAVDYAAEVSEALSRRLGRRVRLVESGKRGRIEIEFTDPDDREALITLLDGLKLPK
jgi:ParB family chromosome partitioning protein